LIKNLTSAATKMFVFERTTECVVLNLKNMISIGIISPPPPIPAAFAKAIIAPKIKRPKNSQA